MDTLWQLDVNVQRISGNENKLIDCYSSRPLIIAQKDTLFDEK